jgi:MoxR-like ATPase
MKTTATDGNAAVALAAPAVDVEAARAKVWQIRDAMCAFLTERDEAVEMTLAALVTNEHTFTMGPPGTAKSLLIDTIVQCLEPASKFAGRLMHKAMTPDELFGALDLAKFQLEKVYRRNLVGGIADAEIVFLDEIWKANTLSLNALLNALNERKYSEQGIVHQLPLRSCFSASNEFPQDDSLGALYDRFLYRDVIGYIQDDKAWEALLLAKADGTLATFAVPCQLTIAELDAIAADVNTVTISAHIVKVLRSIKGKLAADGIVMSDRRAVKLLKALKAAAWLDGESDVNVDHMQILRFVLWDTPEQREKVLAVLRTLERSEAAKAIESIDKLLREGHAVTTDPTERPAKLLRLNARMVNLGDAIKERIENNEFGKRGTAKVKRRMGEMGVMKTAFANEVKAGLRV